MQLTPTTHIHRTSSVSSRIIGGSPPDIVGFPTHIKFPRTKEHKTWDRMNITMPKELLNEFVGIVISVDTGGHPTLCIDLNHYEVYPEVAEGLRLLNKEHREQVYSWMDKFDCTFTTPYTIATLIEWLYAEGNEDSEGYAAAASEFDALQNMPSGEKKLSKNILQLLSSSHTFFSSIPLIILGDIGSLGAQLVETLFPTADFNPNKVEDLALLTNEIIKDFINIRKVLNGIIDIAREST